MSGLNSYFQEEPDLLVLKVNALKILPVTLRIDNNEETRDMIVMEADDLTGRFVNGYSYRFSPSRKRNSKWQMWLRKCSNELGRRIQSEKDLVGRYFEVKLEEWTWGEGMSSIVPVIVAEYTEEEAKRRAKEISGRVAPTATNDEMERIVELLDGKTYNQVIQAVVADPEISKNEELVSQIVSKEYMDQLIDAEMLEVDADGVYHRSQGL